MSAEGEVRLSIFLLPEFIRESYVVEERHHACAVLATDFPHEWDDLLAVLTGLRLRHEDLVTPGGNKSLIAKLINGHFGRLGWEERPFDIQVTVDGETTLSPTHHVDYFKNRVAVETEWNNKDPFYDRDLTVFRLLHEYNVVSVGIVITRSDELQALFDELGRGKSYGKNTTHMGQLIPRIHNRVGGGCPVLALGIKRALYVPA